MQPYFLPYIGYFQLIAAVDLFVIYDNIKYTKKGWINRNRMLLNGSDVTFSLPLKKDSDSLHVVQRELAADFDSDKLLNKFYGAYARAPYFSQTYPLLEKIVSCEDNNLFRYIYHSLINICAHLGIGTEIRISSEIDIDLGLKGRDKVIALCQRLGGDTYINAIGGTELYVQEDFAAHGIELNFIRSKPFVYPQFGAPFVPWLSIVDVMMFNPINLVREHIRSHYDLV